VKEFSAPTKQTVPRKGGKENIKVPASKNQRRGDVRKKALKAVKGIRELKKFAYPQGGTEKTR